MIDVSRSRSVTSLCPSSPACGVSRANSCVRSFSTSQASRNGSDSAPDDVAIVCSAYRSRLPSVCTTAHSAKQRRKQTERRLEHGISEFADGEHGDARVELERRAAAGTIMDADRHARRLPIPFEHGNTDARLYSVLERYGLRLLFPRRQLRG